MSMSTKEIDEKVRSSSSQDQLSEHESEMHWSRIEAELASEPLLEAKQTGPLGTRRLGLALVALGVAVALVTFVAFSPWRQDGDDGLRLAQLGSVSAAEVLQVTADSAGEGKSLVPGKGQVLYFRLAHTTDYGIEGSRHAEIEAVKVEEWIDRDGRGVRIDAASGGSSSSGTDGQVETSPLRSEFNAARNVDSSLLVTDSWRAIFTLDQLLRMPTAPDDALRYVREATRGFVAKNGGQELSESGIVGVDFLVVNLISRMLMEAPLEADQRAALYELLSQTTDWYQGNGSAKTDVSNQGEAVSRDGVDGILVKVDLELNQLEAAILSSGNREVSFGVLLDPIVGTVLETQIAFGKDQPPFLWVTSEVLELRDRDENPAR